MQQQKTNTSLKSKYLLHPYYVPGTLLALWVQCWKKTGKVLSLKNILLFTEGIDWCYSPSNIARLFSFSLSHVSYLGLFHFFNASGYNRQIFIFRCFNMIQVFFFFFSCTKIQWECLAHSFLHDDSGQGIFPCCGTTIPESSHGVLLTD